MYKIKKKELVSRRPDWLVTLLLNIHPSCYDRRTSKAKTLEMMGKIKDAIDKMQDSLQEKKITILLSPEKISLINSHHKECVRFTVEKE